MFACRRAAFEFLCINWILRVKSGGEGCLEGSSRGRFELGIRSSPIECRCKIWSTTKLGSNLDPPSWKFEAVLNKVEMLEVNLASNDEAYSLIPVYLPLSRPVRTARSIQIDEAGQAHRTISRSFWLSKPFPKPSHWNVFSEKCAESVWTDNCPNARSSWKSKRTAQIRMEPSRVFKESKEIDKQISQLLQSAPSVSSFSLKQKKKLIKLQNNSRR